MSVDKIDIKLQDAATARDVASDIDGSGKYFFDLCERIENVRTKIRSNWEGDTTDINDLEENIKTVVVDLINYASTVRAFAERTYDFAEELETIAARDRGNLLNSNRG